MPLGTWVRQALGRYEPVAIHAYRRAFINLDDVATTVASVTSPKRILEVGCGDGAMAAALQRALPACRVLGIDPGAVQPGHFYDADHVHAEFRSVSTSQLISEGTEPFDLVMLCDTLHHVADSDREQVLRDAAALTAPGGSVAVKEWERGPGRGGIAYYADRYVSGDTTVRFMPYEELQAMLKQAMPGWQLVCEARIPPHRANLLQVVQRPHDG